MECAERNGRTEAYFIERVAESRQAALRVYEAFAFDRRLLAIAAIGNHSIAVHFDRNGGEANERQTDVFESSVARLQRACAAHTHRATKPIKLLRT